MSEYDFDPVYPDEDDPNGLAKGLCSMVIIYIVAGLLVFAAWRLL